MCVQRALRLVKHNAGRDGFSCRRACASKGHCDRSELGWYSPEQVGELVRPKGTATNIAIRKKCYLILNTIQIRRSTAIRSRRYARVIRVRRIFKGRPITVDTVNICTNQRKTSRQTRIRIGRAGRGNLFCPLSRNPFCHALLARAMCTPSRV